jgi:hypothetical protein
LDTFLEYFEVGVFFEDLSFLEFLLLTSSVGLLIILPLLAFSTLSYLTCLPWVVFCEILSF